MTCDEQLSKYVCVCVVMFVYVWYVRRYVFTHIIQIKSSYINEIFFFASFPNTLPRTDNYNIRFLRTQCLFYVKDILQKNSAKVNI